MIKPHKFLNLNNNVLKSSSKIIKILHKNNVIKYNELYNILRNDNKDIDQVFMNSLNFLFLLGKIKYHKENDALELDK